MVLLDGNITSKIKADGDKYTFRDSTGEIVVEIDDKVFAGSAVTPSTRVRLTGEVDTHIVGNKTVDVKRLDVIDPVKKAKDDVQGFFEELFEK